MAQNNRPEWDQAIELLVAVYELVSTYSSPESELLSRELHQTALELVLDLGQLPSEGELGQAQKEALDQKTRRLGAGLQVAIKLSLGSREANSDLLALVEALGNQFR